MTSKTHDIGAFAAFLTIYKVMELPWPGPVAMVAAAIASVIGALLPDLDQASNRLWDLLPGGNLVGKVLRNLFLAHRTLSHSLLGIFITYKASMWLVFKIFNPAFVNPGLVFIALMTGYLSHIVLDSLTEGGVPLLFPIKWKFGFPPIRWMRIKTDQWFENLVVFPGITVYAIWITISLLRA